MWFFRSRQPVRRAKVHADCAGRAGRSDHRLWPMRLTWSGVLLVTLAQLTACAGCSEVPAETPSPTPTGGVTETPSPTPTATPTPVPTPCLSAFSEAQAGYLARQGMAYLLVEPQLMPYFLNRKSGEAGEWQGRMAHYVGCLTGFFRDGGVSIADPVSGCDVALAHASQHISEQDFDAYVGVFERALLAAPEGLFAQNCLSTYQNALEGILVDGSSTPDGQQAVKQAVVDPTQASAPTAYNLGATANPVALWEGVIGGQKLNYVDFSLSPFLFNGALNQRRHSYCLARYICQSWAGPCVYGQEVLFSERNAQVCSLLQLAGSLPATVDCQSSELDLSPYLPVVATGEPDPVWYLQQFSLERPAEEGGEQVCQDAVHIHDRYAGLITSDEGRVFVNNLSKGMSDARVDAEPADEFTSDQLSNPESVLRQISFERPPQDTPEFLAMPLYQQLYGVGGMSGLVDTFRSRMEQYSAYDPALSSQQYGYVDPGAYFLNDRPDIVGYGDHMLRWKQCMLRYLCQLTDGPCAYGDEQEDPSDVSAGYTGNELLFSDELGAVCRPITRQGPGALYAGMGLTDSVYSNYMRAFDNAGESAYALEVYQSRAALSARLNAPEMRDNVVEEPNEYASVYDRVGHKVGLSGAVASWNQLAAADDGRLGEFFPTESLMFGSRMNRCLTRLLCEAVGGPCDYGADSTELAYATQSLDAEDCRVSMAALTSLHSGLKAGDGTGIQFRDFKVYVDKLDAFYPGNFYCQADVCLMKKILYEYCPAIVTDISACPEPETVCTDTGPCE